MRRLAALGSITLLNACAHSPLPAPEGATVAEVRIDAEPTPAWIFVDGTFIGRTPVSPQIPFTHTTRFIEVVAVPITDLQTRQVLRIVPPALPEAMQFFLDNQDPRDVQR